MTSQEFKTIREKLNINQSAMGFILDRKRSSVNVWENGKEPIPRGIEYLCKFYDKYGIEEFVFSELLEILNLQLVKGGGRSCEGCCFNLGECKGNDHHLDLCDKGFIFKKLP